MVFVELFQSLSDENFEASGDHCRFGRGGLLQPPGEGASCKVRLQTPVIPLALSLIPDLELVPSEPCSLIPSQQESSCLEARQSPLLRSGLAPPY